MTTTRFADHLLTGIHSARPAASAVPAGTLYSCTTHSLIYQSDGSSAWSTYATLGSPYGDGSDPLFDAKGDLPVGSAPDSYAILPVGSNTQVLTADSAQTLGVKWATPSTAPGVAADTIWDTKGDLAVGSAADTAAKLAVGSNGQVLTADSTQTLGIKWSAAAGGMVADTLWDAKGDLAVGSAADTGAKLAVGSNGQVLTADSTQTLGVKWAAAGGSSPITKLFDSTVTGSDAATIDTGAGGIAGGYTFLDIVVSGRTDQTGNVYSECLLRFNNDSTSNHYAWMSVRASGTSVSSAGSGTDVGFTSGWDFYLASSSALTSNAGSARFTIPNYDNTTFFKAGTWTDGLADVDDSSSTINAHAGTWKSTAAITRISIATFTSGKKFKVGTRMIIYGYS